MYETNPNSRETQMVVVEWAKMVTRVEEEGKKKNKKDTFMLSGLFSKAMEVTQLKSTCG